MNPFQSLRNYEEFIYTLNQTFPFILETNLVVARRGKRIATLQGEIILSNGYRINIKERLSFDFGPVKIEDYGYEIWYRDQRVAWYDSQPHPQDPSLAMNHPHHKHIPPDIKHNRIPAPNMSFEHPNIDKIITELSEVSGD